MNERLFKTLVAIYDYVGSILRNGNRSDRQGIEALQNIMNTCRLELIEQRKLGIEIPMPESLYPDLAYYEALLGLERMTEAELFAGLDRLQGGGMQPHTGETSDGKDTTEKGHEGNSDS